MELNIEGISDKFVQKCVYDCTIFDKNNNQIAYISSVQTNEIIVTRNGRLLFKLTDALIDKKFLEYIMTNLNFEGKIKANTILTDVETTNNFDVDVNMLSVKMLNYRLKNFCNDYSVVNIVFELFKDDNENRIEFITC